MNTKNNQRTHNTEDKIKKIFIELLGGNNINQVTVQNICKKANINRSTFYAHYEDIYDLMQKIVLEKQQGIRSFFTASDGSISSPLTEKNLESLFNYILQNADFYRIYLNDLNNFKLIHDIKSKLSKDFKKSDAEAQYQIEYCKSGLLGVIKKWLNTNCKESPAEMTLLLKNSLRFK